MKDSIRERVRAAGRERAREEAKRIGDGWPLPIGFEWARYASRWATSKYRADWFDGFDHEVRSIVVALNALPPTRYHFVARLRAALEGIAP